MASVLLSRRDWAGTTAVGVGGFSASGWLDVLAARAAEAPKPAGKKACVVLFLSGGLSQVDSFDMKPDSPNPSARGHFKPIRTAVPGVGISEKMPKIAGMMKDFTLLRGMSTTGEHGTGAKLMHHAGLFPKAAPALKKPNLGAVVSASLGDPDFGMPTHVVIGRGTLDNALGNAGFLGAKHNGMLVPEPGKGIESLSPAVGDDAFADRMKLFEELEEGFAGRHRLNAIDAHRVGYGAAVDFMRSSKARAFDLNLEPAKVREAYGRNQFGDGCLMARRLVEVGVPFVEVKFQVKINGSIFGSGLPWDTHTDMTDAFNNGLPILDAAMSSLVSDLKDRGRYDSTLVVCMSEMGRNPRDPKPGGKAGRGHYPKVWTAVVGGAGTKTGLVVGKTDADGAEVVDRPISAAELLGTVCAAVGIDPGLEFSTRDGLRMDAKRTPAQEMTVGTPAKVLDRDAPLIKEIL